MDNQQFHSFMANHFMIFEDENGIDINMKTKGNETLCIDIDKDLEKSYYEQFKDYVNHFNVDAIIDARREDSAYRNEFTVRESVKDFEDFEATLKELIDELKNEKLKALREETPEKRLADMESIHRIQVENGRHFFWVEGDDKLGNEWQAIADKTKDLILLFKEKHKINTPNWWDQ